MIKKIGWFILFVLLVIVACLSTLSDAPIDDSEKFITIDSYLSKGEILADLDTLVATFEKIHPKPYRFLDQIQLNSSLDSIKENLGDSSTRIQFWRVVDKLICTYNDAHSYADDSYVLSDYIKNGGLFFPLAAEIDNGKIRVTNHENFEQILPHGTEIQKINGNTTQELIRDLTNHSNKETHNLDLHEVSDDFGFYFWKAYDWDSEFTIHYLSDNTSTKMDSITVKGVAWEQRKSKTPEEVPSLTFSFLEGNIGYMKITDFNGGQNEIDEFYTDSFDKLKEQKSNYLILDFRNHTGGRDSYGEYLATYFAKKPYRKMSRSYWKITPEFKEAFDRSFIPKSIRWIKPIYLLNEYSSVFYGAQPNEMVTVAYEFKKPLPAEKRFQGKVFLITDHSTFSAGSIFAEMFKHFNMGLIVGKPTGNLYSFSGFALANFTLPNSKLTYQVSSVYNLANNKEEGLKSVKPDYLIDSKEDPLEYILKELVK